MNTYLQRLDQVCLDYDEYIGTGAMIIIIDQHVGYVHSTYRIAFRADMKSY